MSTSGFQLVAGRIPAERIATDTETTDSTTFTAETEIASITAPLVAGRTYRIRSNAQVGSSVSGDVVLCRIREDNVTGTLIFANLGDVLTTGNIPCMIPLECEFTAVSTGDKTFSVTAQRSSGTGNIRREATTAPGWPMLTYVDYIRG